MTLRNSPSRPLSLPSFPCGVLYQWGHFNYQLVFFFVFVVVVVVVVVVVLTSVDSPRFPDDHNSSSDKG